MANPGAAPLIAPWRGMLLYLAVGVAWVFAGDVLLAHFVTDPATLTRLQTWKGWGYVALTSLLAGWVLRRARRADQGRRATAQELSLIVRHAPAGVARVAPDGRLLWANARLQALLGVPLADVLALNFREVMRPADPDVAQAHLQRLLAGEIDHFIDERVCRRPGDGREVPVLCTITLAPGTDGDAEHLVCMVQNLDEIQAARAALQRSEARQRLAATVVDNTLEGVVVTDAQSRILSVNAAVTRMLGYTEAELLGKTPRVFQSGRHGPAFYDVMWDTLRQTGHWKGEIWNRRKNGEVFPEQMSLSAVRDPAGEITHYVCMFTDVSEEKAQQQRLEFLAHRDALTGLANRNWFGAELELAVSEARESGEIVAVLLINLDRFKDVNDSYGHTTGDAVLRHIARQVQSALRPGDVLGRLAGDELAVVARHLRHADGAAAVARHLIAAVAEPWRSPDGFEVVAGASVGICMFPDHAETTELLLQGAHAAVYGAKARGRGAWCFFHEAMTQAARERLALESRLRLALAQGQLEMYYQPQIDIATGRVLGAEALVRWNDPQEGVVSPARFIPVAESSGVIGPMGEWVLHQVCRQGQAWRAAGLPDMTLAVNVSPRQFHLTDLVGCASQALHDSGFPPALLELEITESALAERTEDARQVLERLRALGLRIAIDDFGTGYSSLAQLKRFPIDVLKIDQGFIRDIPASDDDMAISAAIIAMGHSMGMAVLAEGVETAGQLAFLRERGCDAYQGYLCSRPLPASEFMELLQTSHGWGATPAGLQASHR
ncbi:putative bifunctional diguanylate cyclase/phosphodiesterase [Acidovorax sp. RAC01]|uniref:putative bifunctional diguanylate cyclase/phosphodiesterase n=1 Tax=Acidovorax sp. RAC01 TaxID=1842533 RepID=UPI00083E85DB|nr:EAL domain-containing protein [Acidovorax sp. RAC01]AOG24681.1 diguanylate cyclase domain protein [Acidovorax sp. RAC01]